MKPVIVALDFDNKAAAFACVEQLANYENVFVKVGMEMFYAYGPEFVKELKQLNVKIFLDVKMYDIPNTVEHAAFQIGKLGVDIVTVHAAGGPAMIEAAKRGLQAGAAEIGKATPMLLAITQLTSFSEADVQYTQGISMSLQDSVIHLARLAAASGADGVVASAFEAQLIHDNVKPEFKVITPGIRLAGDEASDQKRVVTPKRAAEFSSDGIVVGRSITQAHDMRQAYQQVLTEFEEK